jgi:hypothetical protein
MILAYANLPSGQRKRMLNRIEQIYNEENSKVNFETHLKHVQSKLTSWFDQQEITLKDYEDFFKVLCSIHDIDTALKFYTIAGASIDKSNSLFLFKWTLCNFFWKWFIFKWRNSQTCFENGGWNQFERSYRRSYIQFIWRERFATFFPFSKILLSKFFSNRIFK